MRSTWVNRSGRPSRPPRACSRSPRGTGSRCWIPRPVGSSRIAEVEATVPATLMNDGKCDAAGRFWAGTKDVEGRRPLGSLFRVDADRSLTTVLSGVTLSNGLGWSPDQRTMYYIDSTTYGIDAFDFEQRDRFRVASPSRGRPPGRHGAFRTG